MSTLLLLAPVLSWAHHPHDVVPAVAPAPDFEESGHAWMIMGEDWSQLLVTDDWGAHWTYVGGQPSDDELLEGAYSGDTLVLAGKTGLIWTSDDEGATWAQHQLPDRPLVLEMASYGTTGFIATSDGLYLGDIADPAGMSVALAGLRVEAAEIDGPRVVAATDDGALWYSDSGGLAFAPLEQMPEGEQVLDLALGPSDLYIGTDGRGVMRLPLGEDGELVQCGDMPYTLFTPANYQLAAPQVRVRDDMVLAANGYEAVFFSRTGCATWNYSDSGMRVDYEGDAGADNAEEAWTGLERIGDVVYANGFQGIAWSGDAMQSWTEPLLVPEMKSRGGAIAPNFPDDPRLLATGYGGGVRWTADGGATWAGSAVGLDWKHSFGFEMVAAADFETSDLVFLSGWYLPYYSDDAGQTWHEITEQVGIPRVWSFERAGDRVYALGSDGEGGKGMLAWTTDGTTWTRLEALDDLFSTQGPSDVYLADVEGVGDDALVVVAANPTSALASTDDGATWTWLYQGPPLRDTTAFFQVTDLDGWQRWMRADSTEGLWVSDDLGETWREAAAAPEGQLSRMVKTSDQTLIASTRWGQFWRSEDGGDTWVAVGEMLPAAVMSLEAAERFEETGTLLAGTGEGLWWSTDRGDTWQPFPRFERYEAGNYFTVCESAPALPGGDTGDTGAGGAPPPHDGIDSCMEYEDLSQGMEGGLLLAPRDSMSFTFTGYRFVVKGPIKGEGFIEYEVNGETLGAIEAGQPFDITLDQGTHDVRLIHTGSIHTHIDVVEVYGDGVVLPVDELIPEPIDTGDTGDTGVVDSGDSGGTADGGTTDGGSTDGGGVDDTGPGGEDTGGEGEEEPSCGCGKGGSAWVLLPLLLLGLRLRR